MMSDNDASVPDRAVVPSGSSQQAASPVPASIPSAECMAIWRCGVGTGVQVTDRVLVKMHKSRSRRVREFAEELDGLMQMVVDQSRAHLLNFSSYADAARFDKDVNIKAAQAIEARRAETLGSVHESAMATPCAQGAVE